MVPHQGHLFSEMGVGTENHGLERRSAEAFLSPPPIDPARPGAEMAILKNGVSLFNSSDQAPLLLKPLIRRLPCFPFLKQRENRGREEKRGTAEKQRALKKTPPGHGHPFGPPLERSEGARGRERNGEDLPDDFQVRLTSCQEVRLRCKEGQVPFT
jgi:hypothetical protein